MVIIRKIRMLLVMSVTEVGMILRSTKLFILGIYLIFVKRMVIDPLIACSDLMNSKISWAEIFCSLNNSSFVFMVMPLTFLVIISDFPKDDGMGVFYQLRCKRSSWIIGQLLFEFFISAMMIVFNLLVPIIMIGSHGELNNNFSYATTHYITVFPEKSRDYVVDLVPGRLYNQLKLGKAFWVSAVCVFFYFLILSTIQLFFYLINKKNIGIIVNILIIGTGCILLSFDTKLKWLFPMSHTIPAIHFEEYVSKEIFPLTSSILYLVIMYLLLVIMCFLVRKKKQLF